MSAYTDSVLADAPLMYTRLSGTNCTQTIADSSGNGRNGASCSGAPVYQQTSLLPQDTGNYSCKFNADSYLTWAWQSWMDTSSYSIECWMKPAVATGNLSPVDRDHNGARVFQYRTSGTSFEYIFWTVAGGPSNPFFCQTSAGTIAANTTYHVVTTYNHTTGVACIYLNGALSKTTTVTASPAPAPSGGYMYIGASGGGASLPGYNMFNGLVDDVAWYGTALSAARVLAHYNAATTAPTNDCWVWDGAAAIPANMTVWNGTAEIPADVSVT